MWLLENSKLHMQLLFLLDNMTLDEGPKPSLNSRGAAPKMLSNGKVSSQIAVEEQRKLRLGVPLTRSDHRKPLEGGAPIR